MAKQPDPGTPAQPGSPPASAPAGSPVPASPAESHLLGAGAPHSTAQQLVGMGCDETCAKEIAAAAKVGTLNWGALLDFARARGQAGFPLIMELFSILRPKTTTTTPTT
jgi:hypothetical protein